MKKNKLQKTFIVGFSLLAVCLILVLSTVVALQHISSKIKSVSQVTFGYTSAAAEYIDGDRIAHYVETEEKDEYYNEIMDFLNSFLTNSDLQYYYVFVPYEDDLVYVWDADAAETADGTRPLGYHEQYMENGKAAVAKIYRENPPQEISFVNDETYGYIASAYSPVFNSKGEPVAVVGADVYVPNLEKEVITSLLMIIVSIIAIIVVTVIVFFYLIRKKVIKPIHTLHDVSRNMVDNLETGKTLHIGIQTGNEIEDLADSFERMYTGVKDYISRLASVTAEKERIGAELDVATKIQASMLPCIFPAFPERDEFEVYATMDPAKEVGGDFYDFFMVDEDNLAVVVADVSGKGVPAALFMVIGKTLIKDHTTSGKDLGEVFTEVNQILCESNSEELFITAFVGVLNVKTGKFRYVNAGHEIPFIAKKNGQFKPYKIRAAFVLAGMEGIKYKSGEMQLEPGDKLFQYTDGVTEATNQENQLFGMERLEKTLAKLSDKSPTEILDGVKADIDEFVGDAPQFDDITMLCLEYRGSHEDSRTVDVSLDNMPALAQFVESTLEEKEAPLPVIMKMNIVLDEIYSNIVKFSGATYTKVACGVKDGFAYLRFEDDGIPYNPLEKQDTDITLQAEDREIGGLGILMVKKSMDKLEYEYKDSKNILTLSKKM